MGLPTAHEARGLSDRAAEHADARGRDDGEHTEAAGAAALGRAQQQKGKGAAGQRRLEGQEGGEEAGERKVIAARRGSGLSAS